MIPVYDHMKDNYQKIFNSLPRIPLPPSLLQRIEQDIARLERQVVFVRRIFLFSLSTVFLAFFIPSMRHLVTEISGSGFPLYLSLIASDSDILFSHLGEFFLSLIESLPLTSITLILSLVFLLLGAVRIVGSKTREAVETLTRSFA